jgi:hypothetical protein
LDKIHNTAEPATGTQGRLACASAPKGGLAPASRERHAIEPARNGRVRAHFRRSETQWRPNPQTAPVAVRAGSTPTASNSVPLPGTAVGSSYEHEPAAQAVWLFPLALGPCLASRQHSSAEDGGPRFGALRVSENVLQGRAEYAHIAGLAGRGDAAPDIAGCGQVQRQCLWPA